MLLAPLQSHIRHERPSSLAQQSPLVSLLKTLEQRAYRTAWAITWVAGGRGRRTSGMLPSIRKRTLERPNHCKNDSAAEPRTNPVTTNTPTVFARHCRRRHYSESLVQRKCCCLGHVPMQMCSVSRRASPWHRPGRTGHSATLLAERSHAPCALDKGNHFKQELSLRQLR